MRGDARPDLIRNRILKAPLILASASPRRRDLLARLGIPFDVRPVDIDERTPSGGNPEITARRLAREKAEAARLIDLNGAILAADTVVALDGAIRGDLCVWGRPSRLVLRTPPCS